MCTMKGWMPSYRNAMRVLRSDLEIASKVSTFRASSFRCSLDIETMTQPVLIVRTANGKFCNNFHLSGKCESGEYCDYNHGERLTPGEQLVLKHKARSRSCPKKAGCRDLDCTYGHHCKFGKNCFLENCWFIETHGMDMVSKTFIIYLQNSR